MRKLMAAGLCTLLCAALAGCSFEFNTEDLLRAPTLNGQQEEIMTALSESLQDDFTLKYPLAGTTRTPIQLLDLNNDGVDEAVVCYMVEDSPYARFAVFRLYGSAWRMVSWAEGPGTDIAGIELVEVSSANYLLIEWQTINRAAHTAVLYEMRSKNEVVAIYETAALNLLVADMNGDGIDEICSIFTQSSSGPFQLQVMSCSDGGVDVVAETVLNHGMVECLSLSSGSIAPGQRALIVEENAGGGRQATEVFIYDGAELNAAAPDIFENSLRPIGIIDSREISAGGIIYIPQRIYSLGARWYNWHSLRNGELRTEYSGYLDASLGYFLAVPEEYLGKLSISNVAGDVRRIAAMYTAADGQEMPLCEIKMLYHSDDADVYINSGFILAGESDRYKFYILAESPPEVAAYIVRNFIVL